METIILAGFVVGFLIIAWIKGITMIDFFGGGKGGNGSNGKGSAGPAHDPAWQRAQHLQALIAAISAYLEQTGQRSAEDGDPQGSLHPLDALRQLPELEAEAAELAGYLEETGQAGEFHQVSGFDLGNVWVAEWDTGDGAENTGEAYFATPMPPLEDAGAYVWEAQGDDSEFAEFAEFADVDSSVEE